jgi:hypothetical protein
MKNVEIPIAIKRALINNIPLKKDEIILKTIYNNKCLSLNSLWNLLPKSFITEISTKNKLKENYLHKLVQEGALIRDQAPDYPKYLKAGYSVNLEKAYKERLPYTLMDLNPLPAFEREDYIYYLLIHQNDDVPYLVFPEEKHQMIDVLKERVIYYLEKIGDESQKLEEVSRRELFGANIADTQSINTLSHLKI